MPRRAVSLAEIAAALRETADELAHNVDGCEALAARLEPSPGIADTMTRLRRRAALVAEAGDLVAALVPAERPVRSLVALADLFNRFSRRLRRRNKGE